MPRFGAHLSIAGGVDKAVERARRIRCDCLQLFVKSPSQWRMAPLDDEEVARFRAGVQGDQKKGAVPVARKGARRPEDARPLAPSTQAIWPVVGHASYLLNLASPDETLYERSRQCVLQEWDRAERLGLDYLVMHPGAHMGSGAAAGLARIVLALDWLHRERPAHRTRLALETTAGAGTIMCGRFEHFRYILQSCEAPERIAVAIDTCHLFAAGYDLRTRAAIDETLGKLDDAAGLPRVAVVHANDAKGGLGSGLDRHEHIGRGKLGREALRLLVNHPALRALPFILETPKHDVRGREMDPLNLRALRRLAENT